MGDFHSLDQNYVMSKESKAFGEQQEEFILGVEFVQHEHQKYIDSFLDGHLTELEFLGAH